MASSRPEQPRLRLKDRRRRLLWVKVVSGASVALAALGGVFYVAHLPSLTVSAVTVSGAELAPENEIQAIVERDIAGSWAYLVPRANALAVPTVAIRRDIMSAYPPVQNVTVSINDFRTLGVAVSERQAAALWCAGVPSGGISTDGGAASSSPASSAGADGGCYLMDQNGFIFATATAAAPFERYYGLLSDRFSTPVGATFLQNGFASLHSTINGIGASIRRAPADVLVDNGATDVSVAFAEGGVVRFTRSTNRESMLQNIASVFASQSFRDHPQFDYADFRFGDKVYVKFK